MFLKNPGSQHQRVRRDQLGATLGGAAPALRLASVENGASWVPDLLHRLETIAVHNELGAGMQVALKDLEIRGAGNLLGGEQSGHIAGVGFDLYLRMVGEAVSVFRGEEDEGPRELRLELPVDAVIPEDYVDSERLRLEAYQKLSAAAPRRSAMARALEPSSVLAVPYAPRHASCTTRPSPDAEVKPSPFAGLRGLLHGKH